MFLIYHTYSPLFKHIITDYNLKHLFSALNTASLPWIISFLDGSSKNFYHIVAAIFLAVEHFYGIAVSFN